ncbi:MAG: hypothetical protein KIG16_01405 [Eubacteriales bacterium]|nr:hypothetical protein [Eubacteriales bacterium]
MMKVAIMELGTNQIKLSIVRIEEGKYFEVEKEYTENVSIEKHLQENSELIKTVKIKECINILQMYKQIAVANGVTKYHCVASANLTVAKNYISFLEEINSDLDLEFKLLTEEEEINLLYTAVVNTIDIAKGLIVAISTTSTRLVYYCRRVVLNSATIPMGAANFTNIEEFNELLKAAGEPFQQIDPEIPVIGSSEIFTGFARLSRKKTKYPFDMDHNYNSDKTHFQEILTFLQGLDVERGAKLKGITANGIGYLMNGMSIALSVMDYTKLSKIVINRNGRNIGIAQRLTMGDDERPVNDVCLNSVETILWANNLDLESAKYQYLLASTLYMQLKVLHKLPRSFTRVLKVATLLFNLGTNINKQNFDKITYYAILNSNICGLSHKEIVMAAFVASCRNWDDFMLSEWVKYKDLMDEEDLMAVRKLAMIEAMAYTINLRNQKIVKDISCDVLGDSVIIKLITETDMKKAKVDVDAAKTEIFQLQKLSKEFTKIYKKNVEIL